MDSSVSNIEILGVPVFRGTTDEALELVEQAWENGPALVAYVNAHTLNLACSDPEYRALLRKAAVVLNDGAGVALAARLHGDRFPENLNGSDFNPAIVELAARKGWAVYFLGAGPVTAKIAAEILGERIPGLKVVGTHDGFFPRSEDDDVAQEIRNTGADVVMVAMGNPLQEKWLERHLSATGARLGVGVGAFFDFSAGTVPRSPAWMNTLGIEWVWRLWQEPRRLWRRYLVGNPLFLWRVLRSRSSRKR
ncbi:MAG: WecB/TagA/CpsF family glycosyltransferase [Actinomycetota bacterium]